MFTWICPKCGRECPPAYTECPDCSSQQPESAAPQAAPAVPSRPAAAPRTAAPEAAAPKPKAARASSPGIPTWVLSIVFALAFFGLGSAIYFVSQHFRAKNAAPQPAPVAFETPKPAVAAPAVIQQHPFLKHIEITGWRLLQDPKKRAEIRFVIVNHSGADMPDLAATVFLRAQAGQETEPIGTFEFKLPSLGPYESKDLTAPLNTKLKVYEFPDWQNLFEQIQIQSPAK